MIITDDPAPDKGVSFEGVPFEMIPLSMLRDLRRIEPIDIRLWGFMIHDARFRGHCEYTDAQFAALLGVSQQTVRRALLRLEKASYIDRVGGKCRRILINTEGDGAELPRLKVKSV
jgi:hypothetical protein